MSLQKSNTRQASNSQEEEEDHPTTAQQRAFIRSAAPGEIFGKELFAFDALRMTAALAMGLKYGMVSNEDLIEVTQSVPVELQEPEQPAKPAAKGKKPAKPGKPAKPASKAKTKEETIVIYSAFLADVITAIWLCVNEHSVAFKARRKPEWAVMESTKWATKKGIILGHPNFAHAAKLFGQIMGDVEASRSEPEDAGGEETEPGN